jgi:hypothetical protein
VAAVLAPVAGAERTTVVSEAESSISRYHTSILESRVYDKDERRKWIEEVKGERDKVDEPESRGTREERARTKNICPSPSCIL